MQIHNFKGTIKICFVLFVFLLREKFVIFWFLYQLRFNKVLREAVLHGRRWSLVPLLGFEASTVGVQVRTGPSSSLKSYLEHKLVIGFVNILSIRKQKCCYLPLDVIKKKKCHHMFWFPKSVVLS